MVLIDVSRWNHAGLVGPGTDGVVTFARRPLLDANVFVIIEVLVSQFIILSKLRPILCHLPLYSE